MDCFGEVGLSCDNVELFVLRSMLRSDDIVGVEAVLGVMSGSGVRVGLGSVILALCRSGDDCVTAVLRSGVLDFGMDGSLGGFLPLHTAASLGNAFVCRELVFLGFDPMALDHNGMTAIEVAVDLGRHGVAGVMAAAMDEMALSGVVGVTESRRKALRV